MTRPCPVSRYPYPGFAVVLPNNNATAAKQLLTALAAGGYVDAQTRLLMVELTMFNPSLDMWVQYDFTIESPKAGGFRSSSAFNTVKLYSMFEDPRAWAIFLEVRPARAQVWPQLLALTSPCRVPPDCGVPICGWLHRLRVRQAGQAPVGGAEPEAPS